MYHDAHGWADAPLDAEVGRERGPAQKVGPQGEGVAVRISGFPGRKAFRLCFRLLHRKAVGLSLLCGKTGLFFLTGDALRFCLFSG